MKIHFLHKWKFKSSQQGIGTATSFNGQLNENISMTACLYECIVCGDYKIKNIEGRWNLNKTNID